MLTRPKFPKEKEVLYILDMPTKTEEINGIYTSASAMQLFDKLYLAGIKQQELHCTYLMFRHPEAKEMQDMFRRKQYLRDVGYELSKQLYICENMKLTSQLFDNSTYYYEWVIDGIYISEELANNIIDLVSTIKLVKPKLIIIAGKWTFYFLTMLVEYAKTQQTQVTSRVYGGLINFRGSICKLHPVYQIECPVFCMLPMGAYWLLPEKEPIIDADFKKLSRIYKKIQLGEPVVAKDIPEQEIITKLDFKQTTKYLIDLDNLLRKGIIELSVDIETRNHSVDCVGLYCVELGSVCIPFSTINSENFWTEDEEFNIVVSLKTVLESKNCYIIGQNYNYDSQFLKECFMIDSSSSFDTMIAWHCLNNPLPKSLATIASVCCDDYQYWKDMEDWK